MGLTLEKNIEITAPYKGKTKFVFLTNLQVGDKLNVSMDVVSPGGFGGRRYATSIVLKNAKGNSFGASLAEMEKYLSKLEYKEL